jgi:YVTN family beta-propeller protein
MKNQKAKVTARVCGVVLFGLAVATLQTDYQAAQSGSGRIIVGNTPRFVSAGQDIGVEDPSKSISVSLWLNPHNRSSLDELAQQLYTKDSPNYRHWLKQADIKANFAPTDDEVRTVEEFLEAHKLRVSVVGPDNFFVRAQGTVGDVEEAFHVQIDHFRVGNATYRTNTSDPYIEGPAGALVSSVAGLDDYGPQHYIEQPINPLTGKPYRGVAADASPDGRFFPQQCFTGLHTETFTTEGGLPTATYTGNSYGPIPSTEEAPCGYSPQELWTAYNLDGLYKQGHNGQGQTIVIVDWCGSNTILEDANLFSKLYGLPKLTSSNFKIIQVPVPSQCAGYNPEVNLDVEWAHAIAPGASIDLVVPPSNSFADLDEAVFYAVNYDLGNVISGSYAAPESFIATTTLTEESLISEFAAVVGISTNFSSGDYGDYTGYPFFAPAPTVGTPADLPYATGVGGVSLALKSDNTIAFQTGWGNNQTLLTDPSYSPPVLIPPLNFGFIGGSGGGSSGFFSKPSFQNQLPGKWRQVPDISWLADPNTGVEIVISVPYQFPPQVVIVGGGTSLSCPMFSALWAIANQEAGVPLGQAASYLYQLPPGAITDILPYGSRTNVTGIIHQATPPTTIHYSANDLAGPLGNTKVYYSAMAGAPASYPGFENFLFALTFGTDSSLTTSVGWDNVTGLGTPNGEAFADGFAAAVAPVGTAYVVNYFDHTVSVIDTHTLMVVATVPVGNGPVGVAVTPDGILAYVTNIIDSTVSVIDTESLKVLATVAVAQQPVGVAITPDGKFAYVTAVHSNVVSVIDTGTNTVVAGVELATTGSLSAAFTPDGDFAYVTDVSDYKVSVVDTSTNAVVAQVLLAGGPSGIAITPDGKFAFVEDTADVSVIDIATNTVVARIQGVGSPGPSVAISPDGKAAYVTNFYGSEVWIIDVPTRKWVATVPVIQPNNAAFTPGGNYVYVVSQASNAVDIIETAFNRQVGAVAVGSAPQWVAISTKPAPDLEIDIQAGDSDRALHSPTHSAMPCFTCQPKSDSRGSPRL